MTIARSLLGSAALGALSMHAFPAVAQLPGERSAASKHQISVYFAEMGDDELTTLEVGGQVPKVDEEVAYGLRYGQRLTETWSLEFSVGRAETRVTHLLGADVDLDITTFDADAVWHFARSQRWDPYVAFGVGRAWADLDQPISGLVDGRPAIVSDDNNDYTLNAAFGAKYLAGKRTTLQFEARYRYFDQLLDVVEHSLATFEPAVAIGWRF